MYAVIVICVYFWLCVLRSVREIRICEGFFVLYLCELNFHEYENEFVCKCFVFKVFICEFSE